MPKIVISYRRADSEGITGRIVDRLVQQYGKDSVFVDIDNVPYGIDFRDYIQGALDKSDVMIEVIGPRWVGRSRSSARIKEISDPVRVEVETALKKGIPIIPVLVDGASMPRSSDLPKGLEDFIFLNAAPVDVGRDFHQHMERLIHRLDEVLYRSGSAGSESKDKASAPPEAEAKRRTPSERPVNAAPTSESNADYQSPRDRHLFAPGQKKILALDGGGWRSTITIAFLEKIEKILDAERGKNVRLADYFDLIGGSSFGAIIAAAIALGRRMSEISRFFDNVLTMSSNRSFLSRFRRNSGSAFGNILHREIRNFIGDGSLSSDEIGTGVCIITKRADTGSPWFISNNPKAINWEAPIDKPRLGNKYCALADLVCASIAVPNSLIPIRLPIVRGAEEGIFVNGALSPYGNPSLALYLMATLPEYKLNWGAGPETLTIVSIGAGTYRRSLMPQRPNSNGSIEPANLQLLSLADDFQNFVFAQMQWLGEDQTCWPVNSEIGSLQDRGPPGGKLFRFARYDARLELAWLAQSCGLNYSEEELVKLRNANDYETAKALFEIGNEAAEKQVRPEELYKMLSFASGK
jgi:Patatin-like phospholipase/TIR domain